MAIASTTVKQPSYQGAGSSDRGSTIHVVSSSVEPEEITGY